MDTDDDAALLSNAAESGLVEVDEDAPPVPQILSQPSAEALPAHRSRKALQSVTLFMILYSYLNVLSLLL